MLTTSGNDPKTTMKGDPNFEVIKHQNPTELDRDDRIAYIKKLVRAIQEGGDKFRYERGVYHFAIWLREALLAPLKGEKAVTPDEGVFRLMTDSDPDQKVDFGLLIRRGLTDGFRAAMLQGGGHVMMVYHGLTSEDLDRED